MALSQQEDFAIWYLRTTYLNNCKDGIGDRLININSSVLNTPGFRAAGWTVDPTLRTHSPPIPTAINTEYFQANNGAFLLRQESRDDGDDEEGGMVTGRKSNDTIGPGIHVKRRRRREQIEDDDSSDLSDDSDDDENASQRAAQQIRFARMPARDRSGSSPSGDTNLREKPDVTVTSPSKPDGRKRKGSLGAVEAVKARARADTATSSDLSSENEIDPTYFQRRQINAAGKSKSIPLTGISNNGPTSDNARTLPAQDLDDSDADSVSSAASSELGQTVDSSDLLSTVDDTHLHTSSPILAGLKQTDAPRTLAESPKKMRSVPMLQALPPPRPISMVQPVSLLSQALRRQSTTNNPIQKYAGLSGKGSPNPLWIKIYTPFCESPDDPFEMPLRKFSKDNDPVIVAEAIGLALWRYCEEKLQPELNPQQMNVNKWVLRLVEDGEVEYDFPPLARTSAISDFTMNNNRGARGRSRGKPFDEFALVEASAREAEANERDTPMFSPTRDEMSTVEPQAQRPAIVSTLSAPDTTLRPPTRSNPLLAGQPFASALANTGLTPADKPAPIGMTSTPRLGATKTIRVKYFDLDTAGQTMKTEISTDSYIGEILDLVCRRWNLDKAGFVLKVTGTNTVAALDRTVEALGTRSDLDLVRKRFGAGPSNMTGSPGSASPNAPLLLDIQGPTGKDKKGKKGQKILHPLAQKQDMMMSATNFKKYYVTRRRVTSFSQSSARVLVFDGDVLHNMPADTGKTMIDSNAKTNSFVFADILRCKVSSKHSKLIRLVVQRGTESKRYDFEARSAGEAQEIVDEVTKEMRLARG